MTGTTAPTATAPTATDPRPAYAAATAWMTELLANVTEQQYALSTPCTEFDVHGLIRHIVGTGKRAAAAGAGRDVMSVAVDLPNHAAADYAPIVAGAIDSWRDDSRLIAPIVVPWGEVPGAGVLWGYVNETLVHGWDLAVATGQPARADAAAVEGAFAFAQRFIPEQIRALDEVPFGPVVEPRPEADATERLANWSGRISAPWVRAGE